MCSCSYLHNYYYQPQCEPETHTETFTTSGSDLLGPCGKRVVLRGVNKMVIWTDKDGSKTFGEIAKAGANAIRIVWTTEGSPTELDLVVQRAVQNNLVPIVELHDATGDWSKLEMLAQYWLAPSMVAVAIKHERYLLINVGNEVGDYNVPTEVFVNSYSHIVSRMRLAGYRMPLIIDSRGWAQDLELLREIGQTLIDNDPLHRLMFSGHLYTNKDFDAELGSFRAADLPFLVGEFGPAQIDCNTPVDVTAILEAADKHQTGWLAWSWGPGNTPCSLFDMTTDGTTASLTPWGVDVTSKLAESAVVCP